MKTFASLVRAGLVGLVVLGGGPGTLDEARAADAAAVRCRRAIAKGVLAVTKSAVAAINRCHALRLKGRGSGECNALGAGAFGQARARALARMNLGCRNDETVVANYDGAATVTAAFTNAVFPAIARELEQTANALQTAPSVQGDVKALRKCHGAVGAGWGGVVVGTLQSAFKCQGKRDKRAQRFGPLDPACAGAAGRAGNAATRKIGKACGAFDGLEVGSCTDLPGCLVTEAEQAGRRIAKLAFGGPAVCGNGLRDPNEACDDGNVVETDGCTATCQLPTCGDLSVNQATEDCDEPNGVGPDQAGQNCFMCRLNVCGDGIVDVEEPVVEECDDGNTAANDGCTSCTKDPVRCGANGLTVTMALDFPESVIGGGLGAAQLRLDYAAPLDVPGTGFAQSVRQRVTSLLPQGFGFQGAPGGLDRDTNGDGVDDHLRINMTPSVGNGIRSGPVARAQFDCPAGTEVRPTDLRCDVPIDQLGGIDGNPLPPEIGALVRCALTPAGTP